MWNLSAPPGFQGLREDLPVVMYFRHLPHWRQDGATYFVTFRLHDSLPQAKLRELAALRADWERRHPLFRSKNAHQRLAREIMRRVEGWLDLGMGTCVLGEPANAAIVADSLHYFDDDRYELGCHVIMPNHAHVVLRPLASGEDAIEDILQSWKQFTAKRINRRLGRSGPMWQDESFDRIIRDEEHLYRCIQYIGSNAAKANLSSDACQRWVRSEWESLGWGFDSQ